MKAAPAGLRSPGTWRVVGLLLRAALRRAGGRYQRQRALLRQRSGKTAVTNWGAFGFVLVGVMMGGLNIGAAYAVRGAADAGERVAAEQDGKIVVNQWFFDMLVKYQHEMDGWLADHPRGYPHETGQQWLETGAGDSQLAQDYASEAGEMSFFSGTAAADEQKLRDAVHAHGAQGLMSIRAAEPGFSAFPSRGVLPGMLGSLMLLWWAVVVVLQGEGIELDLQRRRHPMWEWLFSHPVPATAIFIAEMLAPVAGNPMYWSAPLFIGFLYGFIYGPGLGCLAGVLAGIPVAMAAACLGKALEIAVMLRFSPRSRGAMIGIMGWLGYTLMVLLVICALNAAPFFTVAGEVLSPVARWPWPFLGVVVGAAPQGGFVFALGILACWAGAAATFGVSVWFGVWGARRGLAGHAGMADARPARGRLAARPFGKEPLFAKELLWLMRDRSAIVQAVLVPLSLAAYQVFNMRFLLERAPGAWNVPCGAGIMFGTYVLLILGPKSLASEGQALWIALTWPRGLESLLKAKARLWSMISTGFVAVALVYAGFLYPASLWKIGLVGLGWWFFARSMAEKAVTLVSVTAESGEAEKIPAGRRWAATLGMFTFAIGVLTQQWHIAVMGIVYSAMTAAAMWQNFRARMPYLYDPWSEILPAPPTLMQAMIAISILVDMGAVVSGLAYHFVGRDEIGTLQIVVYGVFAVIVSGGVWYFLRGRGVSGRDVWCWRQGDDAGPGLGRSLVVGVACGVGLGVIGLGYLAVLRHIPAVAVMMAQTQRRMAEVPGLATGYRVYAIFCAPLAEEYLFRGLLFRALDREWGGWRAVAGSAAFFAIFHPALSWVPVGLLGVANAVLFKRTRRLAPAVLCHMVYNIVIFV